MVILGACTSAERDSLDEWMLAQSTPRLVESEPLPQLPGHAPAVYRGQGTVDPYSEDRLLAGSRGLGSAPAKPGAGSRQAPPPPLQTHALETMAMVGSLRSQGRAVAIVRVENRLYAVGPGQSLGLHVGKVVRVSDTSLVVEEVVGEPAGHTRKRSAVLTLHEEASP